MNRINVRFDKLKEIGRKALIPYVTAGDPTPQTTVPLMHAMVGAGANIIELGVPFSDPMADGPVIQRASERALKHNISLRDVLSMVTTFRKMDDITPVVLMGYLNPIEIMGYECFAEQAKQAGVDGVLIVDIPPEEATDLLAALQKVEVYPIFLLAPTSTPERIKLICDAANGFVYYVAIKGVTGASHLDISEVAAKVAEIRQVTDLPIGVGFGIKDAETAEQISKVADAVVVGSALVSRIEAHADEPQKAKNSVVELLLSMRKAMG
ncbi:MAG: tryptophan synthase subunit alpha [Candidatus Polarisedimenticolaceae bacterium]|nr:tryptophan synthase subunit alpha [Candidatus Polarisedimenticolaceae bacterium]